jgi:tRNA(Ile)-lysidine synthase
MQEYKKSELSVVIDIFSILNHDVRMFCNQEILDRLLAFESKEVWLAVSGGIDSMVACDWLLKHFKLDGIVHINHGLSKQSSEWESFVKKHAESLGVPCKTASVQIHGRSHIEEQARLVRYQAISELLPKDAVVVCAHHFNDQAETLIFRLFRGTGLHGLVGMKTLSKQFGLQVVRPFLDVKASEIHAYAQKYQIEYIQDPSNFNVQFKRNAIRKAFGDWIANHALEVSMNRLAKQSLLLEDVVAEKLAKMTLAPGFIEMDQLKQLSEIWQEELISAWAAQDGIRLSHHQVQEIIKIVHAKEDAVPLFEYQSLKIRRYRNVLTKYQPILKSRSISSCEVYIDLGESGVVHNPQCLELEISIGEQVAGAKKLYQSMGVPPWLRAFVPVIKYQSQQLVGSCGDPELKDKVTWEVYEKWVCFKQ